MERLHRGGKEAQLHTVIVRKDCSQIVPSSLPPRKKSWSCARCPSYLALSHRYNRMATFQIQQKPVHDFPRPGIGQAKRRLARLRAGSPSSSAPSSGTRRLLSENRRQHERMPTQPTRRAACFPPSNDPHSLDSQATCRSRRQCLESRQTFL